MNATAETTEQEIIRKAMDLVNEKADPGEILNISKSEAHAFASLALLSAMYGNRDDAMNIIDGATAIYPSDMVISTLRARICLHFGNFQEFENIMEETENIQMPDEERLERVEMALNSGLKNRAVRELKFASHVPEHLKHLLLSRKNSVG
ncbi:MAG: hypothetical protein JXR95_02545 [Deltaproteobacteria bacterium]|nr:hypothetical protein [Deltaproteobacteria bacterium]